MSDEVNMKAKDSFHSSPTGMIHANNEFTTHRAHADDLIGKGLAVEIGEKKAPAVSNKKAPELKNKSK